MSSLIFKRVINNSFLTYGVPRYLASKVVKQTNGPRVALSTASVNANKDILHITDACVKQLKKVATPDEFLRILVEGGGCSGFTYKFELDHNIMEDDKSYERDGVKVVTDEGSLELIRGSYIDYQEELIKSSFRVSDNPQSNTNCSCGVSFSVEI
ncbi:iron-sulfur cluster assembly 2 homolog, mitochondrial-like [Ciona intestinalis]